MDFDQQMGVIKMYADMRYELNKLSMLDHDYVVKFVGLLPNPWSFILEWAPLMSLEKLRSKHEENMSHFCPSSLFVVLMQVCLYIPYSGFFFGGGEIISYCPSSMIIKPAKVNVW